jgi:hypothetical protein
LRKDKFGRNLSSDKNKRCEEPVFIRNNQWEGLKFLSRNHQHAPKYMSQPGYYEYVTTDSIKRYKIGNIMHRRNNYKY